MSGHFRHNYPGYNRVVKEVRFRDPLNKERRFILLRLDDAPIKGSLAQFLYRVFSASAACAPRPEFADDNTRTSFATGRRQFPPPSKSFDRRGNSPTPHAGNFRFLVAKVFCRRTTSSARLRAACTANSHRGRPWQRDLVEGKPSPAKDPRSWWWASDCWLLSVWGCPNECRHDH